MGGRRLRWVLLCEDVEQESFFRKVVARLTAVKPLRVEKGVQGSAEAFVRRRFPTEVRYVRQRQSEKVALITVIDGDQVGVKGRVDSLNAGLRADGLGPVDESERIAVCVPTRSIETWELWLAGDRGVNESTPYKRDSRYERARRNQGSLARFAAERWFDPIDQLEALQVPSLTLARQQLARLAGKKG